LNPGDELLVPNPGYPPFYEPALLAGAVPVAYDLLENDNFKINFAEIEKKITKRTKAIWVNFPSNPTGQVATLKELEELVDFVKKHDIFLLYDNAYSEITFGDFVAPSVLEIKGATEVALEFCSFSKSYSFAGFRMGWVAGNKEAIDTMTKVKTQMDTGMSLPFQHLGAYALTHRDDEWHKEMLESYQKRRDIIAKYLPLLKLKFLIPKSALYFWAKIPDNEKSAEDFCMKLLKEKQILFTPGNAFGSNGDRFVRISYCINVDHIDEYF
jgi:LL-diaminopimelate aminotransferase